MKALAIKYRPKTFDDVVEQGAVKKILQEQAKTKTHKNTYLFTGGAGTVKPPAPASLQMKSMTMKVTRN